MRKPSLAVAVVLTALAPACSSTTVGTATDAAIDTPTTPADTPAPVDVPIADVSVDVPPDAPTGLCQWRVGAMVVIDNLEGDRSNRTVVDIVSAEGGAWVLTRDDAGTNREPDTSLERLDATGHRRTTGPIRLPADLPTSHASLAVDESSGLRAVLAESSSGASPGCGLVLLDAMGRPSPTRSIALPGSGFSLTGCRALMARSAGFTFLSEQVRALWGVSMVSLDATGTTLGTTAPTVLEGFPPVPFARFGLSDRSFALAWRGQRDTHGVLSVRRFETDGAPRGAAQVVRDAGRSIRDFVATEAGDGLMALWEEPNPSFYTVALRPLSADGSPRGETVLRSDLGFYAGEPAATYARGDVLATALVGSGVVRPVVFAVAPNGSPRSDVLAIPLPDGASRATTPRLVATASGALLVYATDPGAYPNRLVAVPLACQP